MTVAAGTRWLTIVVPGSPDPILSPNRRRHGFDKAGAVAQHRRDARYAAVASAQGFTKEQPLFSGPVSVTLLVRWGKGQRSRDLDTVAICCKPYLDGLTDAGIWSDDRQIARLTAMQERWPVSKTPGEVVIEIEPMERSGE